MGTAKKIRTGLGRPERKNWDFIRSCGDFLTRNYPFQLEVTLAGPDMSPNIGARDIKTLPDCTLRDALKRGPYDVIVTSGGQFGWRALSESEEVGKLLRDQLQSGRLVASICTCKLVFPFGGFASEESLGGIRAKMTAKRFTNETSRSLEGNFLSSSNRLEEAQSRLREAFDFPPSSGEYGPRGRQLRLQVRPRRC